MMEPCNTLDLESKLGRATSTKTTLYELIEAISEGVGLRHRQRAKAVGNCYSPIPKATAPVLDPTCEGVGVKFPRATRPPHFTF